MQINVEQDKEKKNKSERVKYSNTTVTLGNFSNSTYEIFYSELIGVIFIFNLSQKKIVSCSYIIFCSYCILC